MSMLLSPRRRHRYLVQVIFFVLTLFYCLRQISHNRKGAIKDVRDGNESLGQWHKKKLKGKPFDLQVFKLKVDFSSEDAGAKIVAQSKALSQLKNIQNNDRNTYLLAPCQKTDWFILSFPESISVKHVAFVSHEYYASTYKIIRISTSMVYPSEEWHMLAELETERGQSEVFDISPLCGSGDNSGCWAKYLKVELLDFHNFEENYYCSLTSMNVYGSTAVDVLESEITNDTNSQDKGVQLLEDLRLNSELGLSIPEVDITEDTYADAPRESARGNMSPTTEREVLERVLVCRPAYLGAMDSDTRESLFRFMTHLAVKSDSSGINLRLYPRLVRYMRNKQCGICGLLRLFNGSRHLCNYRPNSNVRCWKIMFRVRLPVDHTWFQEVVYRIIKQGGIYAKVPCGVNGNTSAPLLLCVRRNGFFGGYACYSNFSYTSFTTLKSTDKRFGFAPMHRRDLSLRALYIFFGDQKLVKVVPKLTKRIPQVLNGNRFVKGKRYVVSDEYVYSVTFSNGACVLVVKDHAVAKADNTQHVVDATLKSYVKFTGKMIARVTKDLSLLMRVAKYVYSGNVTRNVLPALNESTGSKDKILSTGDKKGYTLPSVLQEASSMPKVRSHSYERSHGHKHVLLQISERLKTLEAFANKLNKKVNSVNGIVETYIEHVRRLTKKTQGIAYPMHHMRKRGKSIQKELEALFDSWGMKRYYVVFLQGKPKGSIASRECIAGSLFAAFSTCTFLLKDGGVLAKTIRKNSCHISKMRPKYRKGYCNLVLSLTGVSIYMRVLKRYRLTECCRRFGCTCIKKVSSDTSYLLWMPHFTRKTHVRVGYGVIGRVSSFLWAYIVCFLKLLSVACDGFLRWFFNIYTLSLCFVVTQLFWAYRDYHFRSLMNGVYEQRCGCTRVCGQQVREN